MNPKLEGLLSRSTLEVARITARRFEWRDMARTHFAATGRMWRAKLALQAGLDLGLDDDTIVHLAVASELAHNASLIQDDWMDVDVQRRGALAVWAKFGAPAAILFSDFLLTQSYAELNKIRISSERKALVTTLFTRRIQKASAGQLLELQRSGERLPCMEYLRVTAAKTGALVALPVEVALAAAGMWRRHGRACHRGLTLIGQGYQLVDDLVDDSPTADLNVHDAVSFCDHAFHIFETVPAPLKYTLANAALSVRKTAIHLARKAAA